MLRNEFRDAILEVAPETPARWLDALTCGAHWDAITIAYASHRLDALLSGADRHVRFAGWLLANQRTFFRLSRLVSRRQRARDWKAAVSELWAVRDRYIDGKATLPGFTLYR